MPAAMLLQITAFGFMFEKICGVHEKPYWIRCLIRTPLCESPTLVCLSPVYYSMYTYSMPLWFPAASQCRLWQN